MTFHLSLITPEKVIFDDEVLEATIPTVTGLLTILPNHASLFTQVSSGEIVLKTNDGEQILVVEGGFLDISAKSTTILADYAVHGKDIALLKAEEAKKQAEMRMKENKSQKDFAIAEGELRRSLLELKVARKYKR